MDIETLENMKIIFDYSIGQGVKKGFPDSLSKRQIDLVINKTIERIKEGYDVDSDIYHEYLDKKSPDLGESEQ